MLRARLLRPASQPIFHVFGANTGVGKTVVSAGLLRVATEPSGALSAAYLKPVQTGFPTDSDVRVIQGAAPRASAAHLFAFREAVGPHLAVRLENKDQVRVSRGGRDGAPGAVPSSTAQCVCGAVHHFGRALDAVKITLLFVNPLQGPFSCAFCFLLYALYTRALLRAFASSDGAVRWALTPSAHRLCVSLTRSLF